MVNDIGEVTVGSVWADTDPRQAGRTIEIVAVDTDKGVAVARLNTPARNVSRNAIGRRTRIRLDRFDGKEYRLCDVEPHRFGTSSSPAGVLGYWPVSKLRA